MDYAIRESFHGIRSEVRFPTEFSATLHWDQGRETVEIADISNSGIRLIGERLSTRWGKPVVVENRPGGDGLVAINGFLTANDDHVLLFASSASFLAHPYTQEKLPYNLERDLQPIARVSHTVLSIGVPGATDMKTIADFIAKARAEPDKLSAAGAAGQPPPIVMGKEMQIGQAEAQRQRVAHGPRRRSRRLPAPDRTQPQDPVRVVGALFDACAAFSDEAAGPLTRDDVAFV